MLRSGGVDKSTVQSEEVWTGKLLSLGPFMQLYNSVGNPDPQDPHVFGPPGSGSISQRYGSGSFPFLIKVLNGLK
jgi:hypothetical protein